MSYATEFIASNLRAARESKGLSQRELSGKSGVPQGHISKIENGAVDLRVSSLVALARVLDLELILVPRKAVPAVKSIVRRSSQSTSPDGKTARQAGRELQRLKNIISHIPRELLSHNELERFRRQVSEFEQFRLSPSDMRAIRGASKLMQDFLNDPDNLNAFRDAQSQFQELRNDMVHGRSSTGEIETVRPAYSLDDNDDG